jgi:hypothetical protein
MLSLPLPDAARAAAAPGCAPTAQAAPAPALALAVALIVWLQFGPLLGLLGYRLTDDALWALSGAVRDALVAALLVLALWSHWRRPVQLRWPPSLVWAALLVLGFGLSALASDSGVHLTALNLRRLALVPLLFIALALLPWSRAQIGRLLGWVVATSAVVALLGIAGWLAPERLWTEVLEITRYTAANGFDRFGRQPFEASGRFFSWDLAALTGAPVRRALSSYLEPTTLAAGMSVALALGLARHARGQGSALFLLLVLACGLLTLSKGFVLYLGLLLAWRTLGVPAPRHVLALAALAVAAAVVVASTGLTEGPFSHLAGVLTALQHLVQGHWLGEGIGEVGNYTNDTTDLGAESGLGNAIAQTGWVALLPLAWLRALAHQTLARAAASRDPGGPWLASWALFWAASYVFSASSQGVGGNALGFLALALYLHPSAHGSRP